MKTMYILQLVYSIIKITYKKKSCLENSQNVYKDKN